MTLSLSQFALAVPLGILFSAVGTVVGLGGGIFMVPLLVTYIIVGHATFFAV